MRRVLNRRDQGCRFPGCTQIHGVDAHHIEHWAHGGETNLDNLVCLCRYHHRLVHEGGFAVERSRGNAEVCFRAPDGRRLRPVPRSPRGDCARLQDRNRRDGHHPSHETCRPRDGGHMDLSLAVDYMYQLAPPPPPPEAPGI